MPRVTVSLPIDIHKSLLSYAKKHDISLSSAVSRMCKIGLNASKKQSNISPLDELNSIEKHCHKLTIQMNTLMKNIAAKQLGYTEEEFEKVRDNAIRKFDNLAGIAAEEL